MDDLVSEIAFSKAKEFVTEQSCGEWSDEQIRLDATELSSLLIEFYDKGKKHGSMS